MQTLRARLLTTIKQGLINQAAVIGTDKPPLDHELLDDMAGEVADALVAEFQMQQSQWGQWEEATPIRFEPVEQWEQEEDES